MENRDLHIIPLLQVLPGWDSKPVWIDSEFFDMLLESSINNFSAKYSSGIVLVPDLNQFSRTKHLCANLGIDIFEYFVNTPAKLASGITSFVRRSSHYNYIIVQFTAPKIDMLAHLLVQYGFEVLDIDNKYPDISRYKKFLSPNQDYSLPQRNFCPDCVGFGLYYQEGVIICPDCGHSLEG